MNGLEHAALAGRRLGVRLLAIAVVVAALAVLGGLAYVGVSLLMSAAPGRPSTCGPGPDAVPIEAAGRTPVTSEQRPSAGQGLRPVPG